MTIDIDTYMRLAHVALNEVYTDALRRGIASLGEHGQPTEIEIEAFTRWYEPMLQASRAENLAKVRSWLEREGASLQ